MKRGLGITGRLVMIALVGVLSLVVALAILLYQIRSQQEALRQDFPLPRQLAAMVASLERTPPGAQAVLIEALNSPGVEVSVTSVPPVPAAGMQSMPLLERLLSRVQGLQGRSIIVIAEERVSPMPTLKVWLSGVPLFLGVELIDGRYLVIRARTMAFSQPAGVPSGFWLAAFSLLMAAITLIALIRETRPLRRLTRALSRFSETAEPVAVKPAGARDVRGLIETVNDMQARISTLVRGRTILAGAISHDLRTYLTRLQLRIEDLPDPRERQAAEADIAAMLAIVDNAMALAKSASGDRKAINVSDLVEQAAAHARAEGRSVMVELAGDLMLRGDPTALKRVLVNLVDNALRYAGQVWIGAARRNDAIFVTVDDDGPGIPEGERSAIFEPFYRLDPARSTSTGGSGLGLALCKQIVESHSGRIWVETSAKGGARFIARLPI